MLTVGTLPVLVIAPFFLIWFATDRAGRCCCRLCTASPSSTCSCSRSAVANLDPIYESAAHRFGAGRAKILRDVYLQGMLPEVLGGIRIALAGA